MKKIIDHFAKVDQILFSAIGDFDFPKTQRGNNLFADLCEIIIQQQLSEKVGDVIFGRFRKLINGKITPEKVLEIPDKKLRNIGTSYNKVRFIKNLARDIVEERIFLDKLEKQEDERAIGELTKLNGIGRWSAEMFLMFSLGREDVFSYGDLGLRRAMQKLYKLKKEPTQKQAEKIAKKWKPYRTYACRILWRSLEAKTSVKI